MKRTDYETLAMEEIIVEMENGFLGGSADVQNHKEGIGITEHKVNTDFTGGNFSDGGWDPATN